MMYTNGEKTERSSVDEEDTFIKMIILKAYLCVCVDNSTTACFL